jgi:hypothetical protein
VQSRLQVTKGAGSDQRICITFNKCSAFESNPNPACGKPMTEIVVRCPEERMSSSLSLFKRA